MIHSFEQLDEHYYIVEKQLLPEYAPYFELKKKRRLWFDELVVWGLEKVKVAQHYSRVQNNISKWNKKKEEYN